ncbi:MAG: HRDC domain-containing protein, partial [Gammaproteobacteria bacterium]|nr:HRDC domain-containing protein [Gammaproteobacteria bacterium]
QPRDEDALLAISGVGETKLQRYGNEFLQVIRAHREGAGGLSG